MDIHEYRQRGKEMVDYIADYLDTVRQRPVFPSVAPGYMRDLIPDVAPEHGEEWDTIFQDIERVIMPGMTHWQSPHMHAYFPALNSFPSLLGDMLADAIGCLGFTWASSPACTELETIVMDWLGKAIGLPEMFLRGNTNQQTRGGGVLQTTASESTFVSLLAARGEAIKRYKAISPDMDDSDINARLVGYCSDQAHSSVEKAGLIGLVKLRLLPCDDNLSLRGDTFRQAIQRDREDGLIPFFLCATLGTTGACAFDNLKELGPICEEEDMWLHIDAAYAGTAFLCPEYRHFLQGADYAQTFAFNPSKWMMVHFDCTAMWVKDSGALHRTFNVNPLYLRHENTGAAIDYMHWQIPLSRRFRALKLWFVLRSFGISGLQAHIRKGVKLAKSFQQMVQDDDRFEIPAERHLGMVVFRLKGENILTETLLRRLNHSGKVYVVPACLKGKYVIRFTVTSQYTTELDIQRDWALIQLVATMVINQHNGVDEETVVEVPTLSTSPRGISIKGQGHREGMKSKEYGMSLILSNVPMSPKFINGSFAAMFESNDIIVEFTKQFGRNSVDFNGRPIRLSPRKRFKDKGLKQSSFDMSMLPAAKPTKRLAQVRQGSLDSKIEEIFDTSLDSDDGNVENGREATMSGFHMGDLHKTLPKEDEDDGEEEDEEVDDEDDDEAMVETNGVHLVCKHCGSPLSG